MSKTNPLGDRKGLEVIYSVEAPAHVKAAAARLTMVNVPFGDPLAALRIDRQKRWIFFDIGSFSQVPARTAHQITDIFISHAHVDHVCGFPWLLGRRINAEGEVCRIYAPPGFANLFNNMLHSFVWDRVGDKGPRFDVAEYHGDHMKWWHFQIGESPQRKEDTPVRCGILLQDPLFQVRATFLDHGIPVMAFSYEESPRYNIEKNKIEAAGLTPGSWIAELQRLVRAGQTEELIEVADGVEHTAQSLANQLMTSSPGQKIVYATDFADTQENRSILVPFAHRADIFVCETSYLLEDKDHAVRTGHMTAQGCAEIASAAQVHTVLPFHFSNRYVEHPERVYQEVMSTFSSVEVPHELADCM